MPQMQTSPDRVLQTRRIAGFPDPTAALTHALTAWRAGMEPRNAEAAHYIYAALQGRVVLWFSRSMCLPLPGRSRVVVSRRMRRTCNSSQAREGHLSPAPDIPRVELMYQKCQDMRAVPRWHGFPPLPRPGEFLSVSEQLHRLGQGNVTSFGWIEPDMRRSSLRWH
jgi:hypothetical protein